MRTSRIFKLFFLTIPISWLACSSQAPNKNGAGAEISLNAAQKTETHKIDSIPMGKDGLTNIYAQAIADYIMAANKQYNTVFDTLFFGKRNFGQADDFPDITLPETIENTKILLVSPELGEKMQNERKSRVYINMIGWVDREGAEFIFVTFSNGFEHQFDCRMVYQHNDSQQAFELEKLTFEEFSRKK